MEEFISVLCLTILLQHAECAHLVNIALHKIPIQNGTLEFPDGGNYLWSVTNSVDGMTDCTSPDYQTYSGTAVEDDPWWQLDLGSIYNIHAVHILGGSGIKPDQLAGFRLTAGHTLDNLSIIYRNNISTYINGDIWINTSMSAGFIVIDLPKDALTDRPYGGTLALCEVEVYVLNDTIKQSSTVSMSGIYDKFGPLYAIDGKYPSDNALTPEDCNCCSVTAFSQRPWWTIDFGHALMIEEVYITGRMDSKNLGQSKDLNIFISSNNRPDPALGNFGDLIWNINISTNGTIFRNTFEPPKQIRFMSITRQSDTGSYLTICEVDFITTADCTQGRYGLNCNRTCGHCINGNNTCLSTIGTCPAGCTPGYNYTGDATCNKPCNEGRFGVNCNETCGNCIGDTKLCRKTDGKCPNMCAPGYNYTADKTCRQDCTQGRYGLNCNTMCGHCINGNKTCQPTIGTCPAGCSPGYNYTADATCNIQCQSGRYGINCTELCGNCMNSTADCSFINGTCSHGCAPGYDYTADRTCKTNCTRGSYGLNCNRTCGHCINGNNTCLNSIGTCPAGCTPGYNYTGDATCNTSCHEGRFGINCNETCGNCIGDKMLCRKTDGKCPTMCARGYNYTADNTCRHECQLGHYGLNCTELCGNCMSGNDDCSIIDGTCSHGCAPGYDYTADRTCKTNCTVGFYGKGCGETCSSNCKGGNTTCSNIDGACQAGCKPGFNYTAETTCNSTCEDGTYGDNCSKNCGFCKGGSTPCSKTDGVCSQCDKGYSGDRCQEIVATSESTQTFVGPVVGVVVVLVIVVVVLVVVLKRRGRLPKRTLEGTNGEADSEFANLEALAREKEKHTQKVRISTTKNEHNESHGYYSFISGDHLTNNIKTRDLWDYITSNRSNNFQDLFEEFQAVPSGLQFECFAAQRDENIGKNKYRNIYPYDHCRVKLKVPEGQTDYINASYIDGYERVHKFIATQGPQRDTIEDFWLMVWQQRVRKVVMLTNIFEMGKDKCEQYWPDEETSIQYGCIEVTSKKTIEKSDYSIRKLELRMEHEKARGVDQFHFKSWPDKDVPDSTWCLVNFWRVAMNKDYGKSPIIVHCSAGIGRTGTFIAMDSLYHQAMTEGGIRPVSVIETLRRQRINMVQTKYQYSFLHEALADALLIGTHFFWASQLPSVCNFFRGRNHEASVTRGQEQFKLICECIASSDGQKQVSSSSAAPENIYEETWEPMTEPEYGNISTLQSEISEYRPKTKDRNSSSIQQMNATYLPNYAKASTYILAETPSESSLPNLWSLVEEQNVTTIVNLTETTHPYFQTSCTLGANGGNPVGRFVVNVVKELKHKEFTIRSIVYKEQEKKENNAGFTVKTFSLSAWQQGAECPCNLDPLIALLEEVNKWHPYVSEAKPVLFICGDGRTRCGLVAAILNESQRMRNEEGHVNIVETVMMMKKKAGDVISAEQFQFLYEAVLAYALRMGYVLDTGDYNNV